jgi:hypothetical protein
MRKSVGLSSAKDRLQNGPDAIGVVNCMIHKSGSRCSCLSGYISDRPASSSSFLRSWPTRTRKYARSFPASDPRKAASSRACVIGRPAWIISRCRASNSRGVTCTLTRSIDDHHLRGDFRRSKPANRGADSGCQLAGLKWFGHIIVSAGLQRLYLVTSPSRTVNMRIGSVVNVRRIHRQASIPPIPGMERSTGAEESLRSRGITTSGAHSKLAVMVVIGSRIANYIKLVGKG